MAKNFKQQAQAAAPVYNALINPEVQEAPKPQDELRTQGRAGMKLPRINLAFSPTNYDYVKVMAGIKGQNLTQYINSILDAERDRNSEAYEKAKAIIDSL